MLGKLAKWLRMLGHDVAYAPHFDDDELIRRAALENRLLLTRDTRIIERKAVPTHLFITSDHLDQQLRQVFDALDLRVEEARIFTRCVECNGELEETAKEAVRERVPPYVFQTQECFVHCPGCDRIYWAGTHVPQMRERLRKLLG